MYIQNRKPYYWFGVIYKVTNIQNNKCYIGQTSTKDYKIYINNHFKCAQRNDDKNKRYFYDAIRKYGKKNFKIKILGFCFSKEELDESEIECIEFYKSYIYKYGNIYGYNLVKGGGGGKGSAPIKVSNKFLKFIIEYFYYDKKILSVKNLAILFSTKKHGKYVILRQLKEIYLNEYNNMLEISRSRLFSGENNPRYKAILSIEQKEKIRRALLGKPSKNKKCLDFKKIIDLYFLDLPLHKISKEMKSCDLIIRRHLMELNIPIFKNKQENKRSAWIKNHTKEEFYEKISK